jgi:hypothetical protein
MLKATGHPALHFPHWLQDNMTCPLIVSIWRENSPWIDSIEILILI